MFQFETKLVSKKSKKRSVFLKFDIFKNFTFPETCQKQPAKLTCCPTHQPNHYRTETDREYDALKNCSVTKLLIAFKTRMLP